MTLTIEQLEIRMHHIGSSDAAAICGKSPFQSASDVYQSKIHPLDQIKDNAAIEVGNLLEPLLIEWACDQLYMVKDPLKNDLQIHPDGIMAANLDAWIDCDEHIEAKTTGMTEGWGDPDVPNDVPVMVLLQCHHQFACAGTKIAHVPVLLGNFGLSFKLYRVERSERLVDMITHRCNTFWTDYIEPRIEPPYSMPSLEVVRRIKREPNRIITPLQEPRLSERVEKYEAACKEFREAEALRDGTQANLIAAMDDAEELICEAGRYTYFEQTKKESLVKKSTFRVLRKRKG